MAALAVRALKAAMSLMRRIVDWFVDDGRQHGVHAPEWWTDAHHAPDRRSIREIAADHLAWMTIPPPTQESLDAMLAAATRFQIVDAGMDPFEGEALDGPLLVDAVAAAQIAALRRHLLIAEGEQLPDPCRCLGSPTFVLYAGDKQLGAVSLHHGDSIRWNRWNQSAPLADPVALLQFLAELGADEPVRELQRAHAADSGIAAVVAGTIWVDMKLWRPERVWASVVDPAARRLFETDSSDVAAWAQLAMMLGDSGAPDLGLIVCLRARQLPAWEPIRAHLLLCLMQLGLARPKQGGLIPVSRFDDADYFMVSESRLDAWLGRHLAPFQGSLERAAEFVLQLALARTGLRQDEPDLFRATSSLH